jgi:hypothetical protein
MRSRVDSLWVGLEVEVSQGDDLEVEEWKGTALTKPIATFQLSRVAKLNSNVPYLVSDPVGECKRNFSLTYAPKKSKAHH